MTNKKINVDIDRTVFNDAYLQYLNDDHRRQFFFGGSSSGKSVFLAQRDVVKLLQGGRNVLVCRQVGRTLRGSVVQEINRVISDWGLNSVMSANKTDGTITCVNGYQIVFSGLDDVEKLKSVVPEKGVFTDIRIEEATETDAKTVKQLMKRQRGGDKSVKKTITFSFNPILQDHWLFTEHFAGIGWEDEQTKYEDENTLIVKTTYKDNRFLTEEDVYDLEHEEDKYFYDVYTLGNWGVLGHVIFKNWEVKDLSGMTDQFTNPRNGLDFGFANDPDALWVSHYDKKRSTIYIYDELYETGLETPDLIEAVRDKIGHQRVVCDSAEPRLIAELKTGKINAVGAKKGKGSINAGIRWLQSQRIVVDKSCINAQNELRQAKWKEGADGKPVSPPMPVGKNNHLIDGGRYAHEEDSGKSDAGFVKVKGI